MPLQLLHLPVEMLRAVANDLENHELRSLRLVCRQVDRLAFDIVGPRNFTDVRMDANRKGLQRLYDMSQAVHVNRCVKRLEIYWGFRSYDRWTLNHRTNKILEDMRRTTTGLKLESLELSCPTLTLDMLRVILLSSRDSLHTLRIQWGRMRDGDRWSSVFADMVGKFPRLRTLALHHLIEGHGTSEIDVDFPRLARSLVVPGWEEDLADSWGTKIDIRRLDGLLHPIEVQYCPPARADDPYTPEVSHVKYSGDSGPDMDQFLLLLAHSPKAS